MNKIKAILVGALASAAAAKAVAAVPAMTMIGWPLPDLSAAAPQRSDGDDPVVGRQICPPLMRLNLAQKKAEELLVKKVGHERAGRSTVFRYELRSGLYWWSGASVEAQDLVAFLQSELPPLIAARGHDLWPTAEFEVKADGPLAASVHFAKEPPFGPYVLNGAPFFRRLGAGKAAAPAFECVGLYRPELKPNGLDLLPAEGYKSTPVLPVVHLLKAGARNPAPGQPFLELRLANTLTSTPEHRPSDKGSGCSRTLELPQMTMIVWNTKSGLMANPALRHAFSQLMPRSALVMAGAAQLAEVAVSPVPREHPGFNPQLVAHSFDLHAVSAALNRLGFRRKTAGSPRLNAQGEALKLTLASSGPSPNLAEKVIEDAFAAVGIGLEFIPFSDGAPNADGLLGSFAVDWPRVNLLANFHSKGTGAQPFQALGDGDLDRLLERYATSLTTATPDFNALMQVQAKLAELEPITVLYRQRACLEASRTIRLPVGALNQRDPDWFRRLLL